MKKLISLYDQLEEKILVGSLALSVVILFAQVIMRSVFNNSLSWTEELARYMFIWQIWLGTSIAFRENQHIKVELIYSFFKSARAKMTIEVVSLTIWFVFCLVLFYFGMELVLSMYKRKVLSAALRLPMYTVYASLAFSLFAVMLRIIGRLIHIFRDGFAQRRAEA